MKPKLASAAWLKSLTSYPLCATLLVLFLFLGRPAAALDLGLTPSDVFGLWTNVNKVLLAYAKQQKPDLSVEQSLLKLQAQKFSNKEPKDVLVQVHAFSNSLEGFRHGEASFPGEDLLTKELIFLFRDEKTQVTPSLVFLNSSHVLKELVTIISRDANTTGMISRFFENHKFENKTPSDVFGLVDLAHRRLRLLSVRPPPAERGAR